MIHGTLTGALDRLKTIYQLQDEFFTGLDSLELSVWNESKLIATTGNQLSQAWDSLASDERSEISKSLREIPDQDLLEIQSMAMREENARRGLVLMQSATIKLREQTEESLRNLRILQAIREFGPVELERRQREKMIQDGNGEPLDQFTARFIFGPPPPPMIPPKHANHAPVARDFLVARVPSGKKGFVRHLGFTIPAAYDPWLVKLLVSKALLEKGSYVSPYAPRTVDQKQAQFYYKLGFKPDPVVTLHYQLYWYDSSWHNGWHLSHYRSLKTKDLTPVD